MALVLGLVFLIAGTIAFATMVDPKYAHYLEIAFITFFSLGPLVMWVGHRFFHRFRALHIVLCSLSIPLILMGIGAGLFSLSGLNGLVNAEIPPEAGTHAAIAGGMFFMLIASSVGVLIIGILTLASSLFGLKAFKSTPPPIEQALG